MLGLVIIGVILLLLLIICLTNLRIFVTYGRIGENDQLVIEVTAWRKLIYYKYEVPLFKLIGGRDGPTVSLKVEKGLEEPLQEKKHSIDAPQVKRWYHNYMDILKRIHDLKPIVRHMLRKVRCDKLEWHTQLGSGDAAETGALTGLIWGIKSGIVAAVSHYILLRSIPKLSVQPIWNQQAVHSQFRCILHFRLGHAMVAGFRIMFTLWKGRERKWQTTPFRV